MIEIIDTHAHLADRRLSSRIHEVLTNAADAGVVQIVTLGTTAVDSAICLDLAKAHEAIFPAVGIHPNDWAKAEPGDWETITKLACDPQVVALGETGLDRHWHDTPFENQLIGFDLHLELARELDKAVVIHCRECEYELIEHLRAKHRQIRGVLHSFCGTSEQAFAFMEMGLYISFAGMLTFANKTLDPLRQAAKNAPSDRILVETDSPYLSPHPFRGKQNEPSRTAVTAAYLADLRGSSLEELAKATTANARKLFGLPETVQR